MSSKTKLADQSAKLAELYSKCSQLAVQEQKEMARIAGTMLPVLAYLDEPVVLPPASLGEPFRGAKSVSLQSGAILETTDAEGRVSKKPLGKLGTGEFFAVLRLAFPELQRLVADKRRATQVRPSLSMKIVLGGSHFVVDLRSYRAVILNSGGDCRELVVWGQFPGGRTKSSRPHDVNRGEVVEVDLGVYKEVSATGSIKLSIECKDTDGRLLIGEQSLRLDGASWQEAVLDRKTAPLGADDH